jgi:hypothetical protein
MGEYDKKAYRQAVLTTYFAWAYLAGSRDKVKEPDTWARQVLLYTIKI